MVDRAGGRAGGRAGRRPRSAAERCNHFEGWHGTIRRPLHTTCSQAVSAQTQARSASAACRHPRAPTPRPRTCTHAPHWLSLCSCFQSTSPATNSVSWMTPSWLMSTRCIRCSISGRQQGVGWGAGRDEVRAKCECTFASPRDHQHVAAPSRMPHAAAPTPRLHCRPHNIFPHPRCGCRSPACRAP